MSQILVVGSVALDTVETPFGKIEEGLGGSATHFSTSASFFTSPQLVAVVGEDFPEAHLDFLKTRGVCLKGLQKKAGKTFRWKGRYDYDLNSAQTLDTQLNVFQNFFPELPTEYRNNEIVFLANIDPELQAKVIDQCEKAKWIALDTMNFWIHGKREALLQTISRVNMVVINEAEARDLAQESNLLKAARKIQSWGPQTVVIKRGEYGALLFYQPHSGGEGEAPSAPIDSFSLAQGPEPVEGLPREGATQAPLITNRIFSAPALPLEDIKDPTGAGDSFAGGLMGYLTQNWNSNKGSSSGIAPFELLKKACIYGSVMASFNVEDFSLDRLRKLSHAEIETRYRKFCELAHF